jgi:hypothetical protein
MAANRTLAELEAEVYYIASVSFTDLNEEQKNLDDLFDMLDSGTNLMYNQRYREDDIDVSSFRIYRSRLAANNQEVLRASWTGEEPKPWRVGNTAYAGPELKRHIQLLIKPELPALRQRGRNVAAASVLKGTTLTHPTSANWYYGQRTTELPSRGPLANITSFLSGIVGKSPENQAIALEEQAQIKSLNEFRNNQEEYQTHPNQPNRGGRRKTRRRKNRRSHRRARSSRK